MIFSPPDFIERHDSFCAFLKSPLSNLLSEFERMCTRAVWLGKGKILAQGDPAEVAAKYLAGASAYTS